MNKTLKTLILFITFIILGWGIYNYHNIKPKTPPVKTETEKVSIKLSKYDGVNVKTVERRENNGRSLLNIAYPVTQNEEINKIVEGLSQEFIESFTEMAISQEKLYQDYFIETGIKLNTTITDYNQHFDVSFANELYISFIFDRYQSTGGTGINTTFVKIFNRQTGDEIPIKDLFTDLSYLERLSKISREMLIARIFEEVKELDGTEQALDEYVENNKKSIIEGTKPLSDNFNSLAINDEGMLTIYFDKYQVAAGSEGIVTVDIPLNQISDILTPEIRKIFSITNPDLNEEEKDLIEIIPQEKPNEDLSNKINCETSKCIALTFDDGPSIYTNTLLDDLKKHEVPATFFVLGRSAKIQPDTITRIANEGHELGNHTWDHKDLRTLSEGDINKQLNQTDELLSSIVGIKPLHLRPPYGAYNNETLEYINRPIILWSVDPEDWKHPPREELIKRMTSPRNGAIILAHDIHQSTVEVILDVITELRKQGFVFVTVSNLLKKPLESGRVYSHR